MKTGFYLRLALDGIRKNRTLYKPYLLTCVMMTTVYYILGFLYRSNLVASMSGGGSLQLVLGLGTFVITAFSALFLFYTNSFLIRKRKKEFGLYNVLGMDKKNLGRILFWENLLVYGFYCILGILTGAALSKLSELILLKLMGMPAGYRFRLPIGLAAKTALYFAGISFLIYLNGLRQIRFSSAIDLVKSENTGEKPPKANGLLGAAGLVLLAAAYYLAVSIQQPLSALVFFFIAVLMVIAATYLIFIAGSVVFCRLLQKNKGFYYRPQNFVSVSSMVYRMKRNGAGLASICILLTMVLVMVSSSATLYLGKEDAISARYPRQVQVTCNWYGMAEDDGSVCSALLKAAEEGAGALVKKGTERNYYEYTISGLLKNGHVSVELDDSSNLSFIHYDDICEVHFIDLADYNRIEGKNETLQPGEAILCAVKTGKIGDTFSVEDVQVKVVKRIDEDALSFDGASQTSVCSSVFLIAADRDSLIRSLKSKVDYNGEPMLLLRWFYQFDAIDPDSQLQAAAAVRKAFTDNISKQDLGKPHLNWYASAHDAERGDFYSTFGGLFFIGLLLSLVFLAAAALIIYYKQISEGLEDQARFAIMQKVGMTKQDIKRTINAQMSAVFLLPILFAVLHLCFAFPFINKLLMLFGLFHEGLLARLTAASAAVCILFYLAVYRLTSNVYYSIVAGGSK